MNQLKRLEKAFSNSYRDDQTRRLLMFRSLNLLLCATATIMSVMNIFTQEYVLFLLTTGYAAVCLLNSALAGKRRVLVEHCFFLITAILMAVFIVTGIPGGFSLLWTLMIPACALAIFGIVTGSVFSAAVFLIIVFFFWLPFGRTLLRYSYSDIYMLRFPVIYICLYIVSLYVEWIRKRTKDKLVEAEEHNRWLYRHDALTGTYSRRAFYEELDGVLARPEIRFTSTIMLDIDDFKTINDTYGHGAGDQVLRRLAEIIKENTCEHSLFCRWGGEEFLILMRCVHDSEEVAERIRRCCAETEIRLEDGRTVRFTISAGISMSCMTDKTQMAEQINRADAAMYAAKRAGKNRITLEEMAS